MRLRCTRSRSEFSTDTEDDGDRCMEALPRHGVAQPIEDAEALSDLLGSLAAAMSSATATIATGQSGVDLRPVVTLALGPEDRALLHQVHEASDWVFTLDRNLGIEFFDQRRSRHAARLPDRPLARRGEHVGTPTRHHVAVHRRA